MIVFRNKKRLLIFTALIAAVIAAGILIALLTPVPIPSKAERMLARYTRNKPDAKISIALITPEGCETSFIGHDGKELKDPGLSYEIGEISQTFIGAIAARAVVNGEVSPEEPVSSVLPIPLTAYSPTLEELVTGCSAYSNFSPLQKQLSNPYSPFSDFNLLMAMCSFEPEGEAPYVYSRSPFGAAVTAAFLGDLYSSDGYTVLNNFVHLDLGLRNTNIILSNKGSLWDWEKDDVYAPVLGLSSTLDDMVLYTRQYLNGGVDYLELAVSPLREINNEEDSGYFWTVSSDGLVYAEGETGSCSACIVMKLSEGKAAIVLSNCVNDKYGNIRSIAKAIINES